MTLKKAVKKDSLSLIMLQLMGPSKKHIILNQNVIVKKETNLLVKYYLGIEIDLKKL